MDSRNGMLAGQPGGMSGLDARFRIGEFLGSGGVAEVYRAVRIEDDLPVALKLPRLARGATSDLEPFRKELRGWKDLRHPHIVRAIDWGDVPVPYIAMEYMPGGALRARIGALTIPQAMAIGGQLAEALFYAHQNGVVHLDVKPENILFDAAGGAKLSDWGLSRVMLAGREPSRRSMGTLHYSAPEQIDPQRYGHADWQTDIWQFGVTLYEMVAGRLPFPGDHTAEVMRRILQDEPAPLPPAVRDAPVPPELASLIMRCLGKEKKDRFRSFDTVLHDLDLLLHPPRPSAAFDAFPTSGEAPLEVAFHDRSTGSISSRWWDFGDGAGSREASPRHSYHTPGSYRPALKVSGPGGEAEFTMPGAIAVTLGDRSGTRQRAHLVPSPSTADGGGTLPRAHPVPSPSMGEGQGDGEGVGVAPSFRSGAVSASPAMPRRRETEAAAVRLEKRRFPYRAAVAIIVMVTLVAGVSWWGLRGGGRPPEAAPGGAPRPGAAVPLVVAPTPAPARTTPAPTPEPPPPTPAATAKSAIATPAATPKPVPTTPAATPKLVAGTILWTRQFGGSSDDYARGVAVDGAGNSYLAGNTGGALPGQASSGGFDAFIIKLAQ